MQPLTVLWQYLVLGVAGEKRSERDIVKFNEVKKNTSGFLSYWEPEVFKNSN